MTAEDMLTSAALRQARAEKPGLRDRDLAETLGLPEARLQAAFLGQGVTRIAAHPDQLIPAVGRLGDVMALTRNESCVIEKHGDYCDYTGGAHACMTLGEIDTRMFPKHWVHGFAVEKQTDSGPRRSLQIFDAAGDAVHKVFLTAQSNADLWPQVVADLALEDQSDALLFQPRRPTEGALVDPSKTDRLRTEWAEMTDTHQFLMMVRRMKLNRLGAYRMAGAPFARQLDTSAIEALLDRVQARAVPIMVFVGNQGCIEIHTGKITNLKPMGPWLNVLDPRFNLHLRTDHIAEVWAVSKNTKRGPAVSVEAFDAKGGLILQIFGVLKFEGAGPIWTALVQDLPGVHVTEEVAE